MHRRRRHFQSLEPRRLLAGDLSGGYVAEDVDRSGEVTPMDALQVINYLRRQDAGGVISSLEPLAEAEGGVGGQSRMDVNRDGRVSPVDALGVINRLRAGPLRAGDVDQVMTSSVQSSNGFSEAELLAAAATFPPMPRGTAALRPFVDGRPTFTAGTPFNDLGITLLDTDYVDGENGGYDTFMPVDPTEEFPGADSVHYVRTLLNTDLEARYGTQRGSRIILGTDEIDVPFFSRGADGIDNDYAVIHHLDFTNGAIQLRGSADDYQLVQFDTTDGVATAGWYLFSIDTDQPDLIAFVFNCDDLEAPVSGREPNNLNTLCNATGDLDLNDPVQFIYAEPISMEPAIERGLAQVGTNGKDIIEGMTVDADGNTYLVGASDGSFVGDDPADHRIFVTKIDPYGQTVWSTELETAEGTTLKAVIADDQYVYAAGRTLGAIEGFTAAGRWDGIILKLDLSDGEIVATDQWGNAGIDGYGNLALDDAGNLFVSGQGSPVGTGDPDDVYLVAKHRTDDLSNVWRSLDQTAQTGFASSAEAWGGLTFVPSDEPGAAPGEGRLVVAGWVFSNTGANAFAAVYEDLTAAVPTIAHEILIDSPGPNADWVMDSAVDSAGNIYFVGYTTGNLDGPHQGNGDAYIAKYDSTLSNPQFVQFGTEQSDMLRYLDIDENDVLYATGYTYGDYAGANADRTLRTGDVMVQKFDTDLNFLESTQFGTPGEDRGIGRLTGGQFFVGGMTEMSMAAPNLGSFDGFVVAVDRETLTEPMVLGDLNGDGDINLLDVLPMRRLLQTGGYDPNADFDFDGAVTLLDVNPFRQRLGN